ncbi:MAG: hypothetical protein R6X02_14105 [Enhygromyxa sp.]
MAELGSVFEADEGPQGPDLRVSVEVPRAALGATVQLPVPERLAAEGELVERTVIGDDEPGLVTLHLPEALPEGAVLRLRGQGGVGAEGQRAGDLWVVVELVDRPPRGRERIIRSSVARREPDSVAPREGDDLTWWLLAGLALICAGILAALFLL